MVKLLRILAKALWFTAIALIAIGIALIILNGGTWPASLAPVKRLFKTLHEAFGSFAFLIQIALFAGPGAIANWLADQIEARRRRKSN